MKVYILTIGDELLIGQVTDTNSARMAQFLLEIGGQVIEKKAIADSHDVIVEALKTATEKADIVLVTGGLGPTKDDVTKKALADFYGVGFVFHQETWERIVAMFAKFGSPLTESLREQCLMPQNAEILTNKMGTAPGMWFDEGGKVVVSMPGVPFEMDYLMEHEVVPRLSERFAGKPIAHRTVLTTGVGETFIAEKLKDFEGNLPAWLKLAYLPAISQVRLRLTASHDDELL
ncbi:MAG: molybdopterin-binding protein, partial [Bacteroidota bacterium]